jgi:spore maturation protein CgeD
MPDISVIIISHNKPVFVKEAVQSVLDQTHQNWEAVLMDSGVLYEKKFFDYLSDPRIKVMPSGETREQAASLLMTSWCFNRLLNSGTLRGELILYLCDDDIFYPEAFATFWNYYVEHNREPDAMYSSQDIGVVDQSGGTQIVGQRIARRPAGKFCRGAKLDCKVDYLQFCHTARILEKYRAAYKTDQYHTEDRRERHHADGIFMERIGNLTTVHPVPKVLSVNRRTADSVNLEYATTPLGRALATIKAKAKGARERLFRPKPY